MQYIQWRNLEPHQRLIVTWYFLNFEDPERYTYGFKDGILVERRLSLWT